MNQKEQLTKLLRVLAAAVEGLDQRQLDQLLGGKAKLTFSLVDKAKEASAVTVIDNSAVLQQLNECRDRNEAQRVLSQITNRDALALFARALKIHVVKHDRREDIESKIIEFVIGGKLRTEAIQSLNFKGGGSTPPPTPQS
jgi:hypothetical protein